MASTANRVAATSTSWSTVKIGAPTMDLVAPLEDMKASSANALPRNFAPRARLGVD